MRYLIVNAISYSKNMLGAEPGTLAMYLYGCHRNSSLESVVSEAVQVCHTVHLGNKVHPFQCTGNNI